MLSTSIEIEIIGEGHVDVGNTVLDQSIGIVPDDFECGEVCAEPALQTEQQGGYIVEIL